MKFIAVLFFLLSFLLSRSQNDVDRAKDMGQQAIEEMEAGNIDKSIELLKTARTLDPKNVDYPYETAYAHYLKKNYSESIKIIKKLLKHPDANDLFYQMLGNCYDIDNQPKKAFSTYKKGIKAFPNSGRLYLEMGNMALTDKAYGSAIDYYETGIVVQPEFSSNYYRAALLYLNSTEEVWGMIYGELFMNLERNSPRTAEISKLLYDTYVSEIQFTADTSLTVSFSKQATIDLNHLDRLPFGIGVYEPVILMSLVSEKGIDLNSLNRIRYNFISIYYEQSHYIKYPNVLFDYQKTMAAEGHLEAYNHWILMKGDEDNFGKWHRRHKDEWDLFVTWFKANPIKITKETVFTSKQYK